MVNGPCSFSVFKRDCCLPASPPGVMLQRDGELDPEALAGQPVLDAELVLPPRDDGAVADVVPDLRPGGEHAVTVAVARPQGVIVFVHSGFPPGSIISAFKATKQ